MISSSRDKVVSRMLVRARAARQSSASNAIVRAFSVQSSRRFLQENDRKDPRAYIAMILGGASVMSLVNTQDDEADAGPVSLIGPGKSFASCQQQVLKAPPPSATGLPTPGMPAKVS